MGASVVCRAVIRRRRSGLFCPSIWKRTRWSPIGTRRHAVGVYPTARSSTNTSANGTAFTLRHLDSEAVTIAAGVGIATGAGVTTGAAAVGAGTALIVAFAGVAFGTVTTGAGTTGACATGLGAIAFGATGAVASAVASGGAGFGAVTVGGADLGGVVFAVAGRAGGSTSRLTAATGATARGESGSLRRPAHVPKPRASRQSAPNATRTGRERSVRRRSPAISRTTRALHARRSPEAASRKAFAKSVAVAYLASGSLTSARRRTRSSVAGRSVLWWRTEGASMFTMR